MCIRDRLGVERVDMVATSATRDAANRDDFFAMTAELLGKVCLLYTSDAADERSSVDLGGRRIIKKKRNTNIWKWQLTNTKYTVYNGINQIRKK